MVRWVGNYELLQDGADTVKRARNRYSGVFEYQILPDIETCSRACYREVKYKEISKYIFAIISPAMLHLFICHFHFVAKQYLIKPR
jgi:hypothetical protein